MKLVVTEKPSVGRDIARVLQLTGKKEGYIEGPHWTVTWAIGHLVELREPGEYNPDWKRWSLEPLPMVPDKFALRPRGDKGAKQQLTTVSKLMKAADEIICATDAGREGELIFRYILQYARCTKKPMRRLWISSLTNQAIQDGFRNLRPGTEFDPLFHAARCRSEADWIVGLNGTRYFTVGFGRGQGQRGSDGRGQLWSVGRVQTPVLALVVERDWQIEHFVPEDYWELHTLYRDTRFKHTQGKFKAEADATKLLEKVNGHPLEITDIKEKKERVFPPLLYDLTALQKDMNKRYGMTADATLKAAQALYERKHLTYPRTDSNHLSTDMKGEIPKLLDAIRPRFQSAVGTLDPLSGIAITKRVVDDAKVTDHHAIIPTDVLPPPGLSGDQAKVWEAVALRFISLFHPPLIKGVTVVEAIANEEPFRARGTVILDPGWQALHPGLMEAAAKRRAKEGDQTMPAFEVGERGPHAPELKAMKTSPPKRHTEASLLQLMETAGKTVEEEALKAALKEKGLGTPATRHNIIETLLRRQYIERQKKNLLSTVAGRHLISLVRDDRLKSAELTGEWEARLKGIEKGEGDPATFMNDVVSYTYEIVKGRSRDGSQGALDIGRCPQCSLPMIEGKRGYGCSGYKEGCTFVLWKELYGVRLGRDLARGILAAGRTLHPLQLTVDGERQPGHIATVKKGDTWEVVWEKPGAKRPAKRPAKKTGTSKKTEKPAPGGPLGPCPACDGGQVVEGKTAYGCLKYREGCRFRIGKTIAKKKISNAMVKRLLTKGETGKLKGFTSKAGKKFDANLKLVGTEVKFDFER